jgi:hypothetical protein
MVLFLDLEETLIDEFSPDFHFLETNISKIRKAIHGKPVKKIVIFSFAIWDDFDIRDFEMLMLDSIQTMFDVQEVEVVPMMQLIQDIVRTNHLASNLTALDTLGKKETLLHFLSGKEDFSGEIVFFDDEVETEQVSQNAAVIQFIDIKKIG